ncbi:MAG: NigD-like protein [Bacteroidales bacterium]|nr:NigD-like protein [Bacteroidales bacterium]
MYETLDSYSGKYNAIVTVKSGSDGISYFQLGDDTTLEPVGWTNPYSEEVRALLNYTELSGQSGSFTSKVRVNQMEQITTRKPLKVQSPVKRFEKDNSPVIVYADWLTSCEDGYLTLHLAARCTKETTESGFSLEVDPSEPSDFYLRHERDDDGDLVWKEFIVAFLIRDYLRVESGGTSPVVLHSYSYDGLVTLPFECKSK